MRLGDQFMKRHLRTVVYTFLVVVGCAMASFDFTMWEIEKGHTTEALCVVLLGLQFTSFVLAAFCVFQDGYSRVVPFLGTASLLVLCQSYAILLGGAFADIRLTPTGYFPDFCTLYWRFSLEAYVLMALGSVPLCRYWHARSIDRVE